MILSFANCELDLGRLVLRRDGTDVKMEPQAFDVLCCLVQRRGQVVLKGELLDQVWGDRFVSESALTTQIKFVRQAVGDDGSAQHIIRTVHGRGYEFVAEVKVRDESEVVQPVARQASRRPSPLPASIQPLIGRDLVLEQLTAALANSRLMTLVGPGGVGKTSVAYELGRRVVDRYVDGVYLVELVTVVDEGATFEAFATALDVSTRQRTSIQDAIVDMLRSRDALLVLDNCEHLVEPVAALVNRILRSAPSMTVLATSREPLAVAGERVHTIEPLPIDGGPNVPKIDVSEVPAVKLFVERARAADPSFELNGATAAAVVEICRRLDGIPLAIELAASRARAIDVSEIAHRLDERFRLLKGVRRGSDPRHRTLEDAISWSYDLLSDDERRLFASLAVFAGPFDFDAAEAVCTGGDVLDLLTRLTERSMLAVRRQAGSGLRYELLETLREYGRRRLDDTSSVALFSAHADYFAGLARSVQADLGTADEHLAQTRAEAAFADLRASQRFALQIGDFDTAFGLIAAIREHGMRALRYEVFGWADAAASIAAGQNHSLHPLLLGISGYGAWVRGEYDAAMRLAEQARREEETLGLTPSGLAERVLANVLYTTGQFEDGQREALRQIDLAEDSRIDSRIAHAYYMCAVATSSTGTREDAHHMAGKAREAGARSGSPTDLASAYVADGYLADPDEDRALEAFAMADRLARSANNRWMSAFARTEASGILVRRGLLDEACHSLAELVDLWYRSGEWSQQWHTLTRCMMALDRIGRADVAAEVVGAIKAHAAMGAPPSMPSLRDVAFEIRDALPKKIGAERTDEYLAVGASQPLVVTVDRVRNALLGRSTDD